MDFTETLTYDASPDEVFAMLCDKDFREEVCKQSHAIRYQVNIVPADDSAKVLVSRVLPADVPDFAKALVGPEIEILQTEGWHPPGPTGVRVADLRIEIPGKPGQLVGSVTISPAGSPAGARTTEAIEGELKVRIPLLGAKLEAEIAKGLREGIRLEGKVGTAWLSR
jgi:Protein of unknown function (DUF2505)